MANEISTHEKHQRHLKHLANVAELRERRRTYLQGGLVDRRQPHAFGFLRLAIFGHRRR